ncbi:uncharacterized protein LOC144923224 [Branchiostoma floridae x Branchiostoma belcheri]
MASSQSERKRQFFANAMMDSKPQIGLIFFSSFMICIFILLMNFLMTIVCDAISAEIDVTHDRDLGEYMWRSFRSMLGFPSPPNKEEDKTGSSKMEDLQANLRDLQEKLDTTLNICDSVLPSHARDNRNRLDVKARKDNVKFQTRASQNDPCRVLPTECKVTIIIEPAPETD